MLYYFRLYNLVSNLLVGLDRVRDTLLHELCHAAVFVVDKIAFGRHGPAWQKWFVCNVILV